MNLKFSRLWLVAAVTVQISDATAQAEGKWDSSVFGGLEARAIGPAAMGGRIAALDAVKRERLIIYVGAASGGVWKSDNGGTTFKPVFDKYTQSIGAIAIDRSKPDIVWVGTGEPWTRNSVSVGTGLYKTTDGGDNWEQVGLKDSERISAIVVDPANSDTVYVCATGHLWNPNEERGVFKTVDGGKTWEKILYVNADTGCGDLAIDPQEPRILYAGMWQFRRQPDFFTSGGPGSGLYKTTDGGKTWRRITNGMPEGELGRIAIAVAPPRPSVVYATVEAAKTGLYRSDDVGETWKWVGTTDSVEARPFYFSRLVADPTDFRRIYKPGQSTSVSTDGGETFAGLGRGNHGDHHALWINPSDPNQMLLGTDGGLYASNNRGVHWEFLQSLPVSQFYHISYDMADPYNVYGGLQDNGAWMGPSQGPAGVQNKNWDNIGGGDGFHAHVDHENSDIVYVEWQGGRMGRLSKSTKSMKDVKPLPLENDPKYRFNWNTPIHLSPNRTDTVYIGGQFLFRTRDRGETWEKISPDLTTNDPTKQRQGESGGITIDNSTAENYCTIYTISESPKNGRIIWVGTDDGNLQVTRDEGKSWTDTIGKLPGLPANTWVSHVEAGHYAEGVAYATFDGHRTGDMKPFVYKTTDFGKTWESLVTDQIEGYCLVIREDLVNPNLLFLGTEFGLYISADNGRQWARFKGNLPKVSVPDIAIHPRENDLIIATHGRGVYILDDITPLRMLSPEILDSEVALLETRPVMMRIPASIQEFPGDDEFVGDNPAPGVQITYYLKKRHMFGNLNVEVFDPAGKLLTKLPGSNRQGINRVSWSLRSKPPKVPPATALVPQLYAFLGPQVPEGTYSVKLTKGTDTVTGKFTAVPDPRSKDTVEDKTVQDRVVWKLYDMLGRLTYVVDAILDVQKQLKERLSKIDSGGAAGTALRQYDEELETFRKTLVATRKGGFLAGEEQLREELGSLYGSVNGFEGRPTNSQLEYTVVLEKRLVAAEKRLEELLGASLQQVNTKLQEAKLNPIKRMTRAEWDEKQSKS